MSRDYMSQYAPEGNSVGIAISQPRIELKLLQTSILPMSRDYMSQYAPEGNSVGVAISQPRVEVRSASTLGIIPLHLSNSVGVAISRRRYHQSSEMEAIAIFRHSRTF